MYTNVHCSTVYNRMIYNPLGIYPVMGLLGQMEFLCLGPWGITTLSSIMVELIYTHTTSIKVFLFLHILSSICCSRFFNDCLSNWCEMVSQCSFDLHFSDDQWWWAFSNMFVGLMSSLVKCLFISFSHFWIGLFVSFLQICVSSL